jgi:hypothetical protein
MAVRQRDEGGGDIEDAIPGQAHADAVVVVADQEALASIQVRETPAVKDRDVEII